LDCGIEKNTTVTAAAIHISARGESVPRGESSRMRNARHAQADHGRNPTSNSGR
jgi:hypothetical protein